MASLFEHDITFGCGHLNQLRFGSQALPLGSRSRAQRAGTWEVIKRKALGSLSKGGRRAVPTDLRMLAAGKGFFLEHDSQRGSFRAQQINFRVRGEPGQRWSKLHGRGATDDPGSRSRAVGVEMFDVYALTEDRMTRLALRQGAPLPRGYWETDWTLVATVKQLPADALVDLAGDDFSEFRKVAEAEKRRRDERHRGAPICQADSLCDRSHTHRSCQALTSWSGSASSRSKGLRHGAGDGLWLRPAVGSDVAGEPPLCGWVGCLAAPDGARLPEEAARRRLTAESPPLSPGGCDR